MVQWIITINKLKLNKMKNSNKTWKQAFAEVTAMHQRGLHVQAVNLMEKLDNKYNRDTLISLDEYLFKYGSTLQPSEFDKIIKLLEEIK
tara:strand:+ start:216 stop:482 length:267 start_codon:yes stop_codon:yes gene_type:complete